MNTDNDRDAGDDQKEVRGVTGDPDDSFTTTTATPRGPTCLWSA